MINSFAPISNGNAKLLILGTMPGEKSLRLQQYYGHGGNHFWKIMFHLYNIPFSTDYPQREALLLDNQIALWDVLHSCVREGTSADTAIVRESPNNFDLFFKSHPNIRSIYFNGKNAKKLFEIHCKSSGKEMVVLPSTSPANTWLTFEAKLKEWVKILK